MRRTFVICLLFAALLAACGGGDDDEAGGGGGAGGDGGEETVSGPTPSAPDQVRLRSPAFEDGGTIPKRFTCDGEDVSPPLAWSGVPKAAGALGLLVEDPDAPGATFVHWILLDIDVGTNRLAEGKTPPGTSEPRTSFGDEGYGGPCPPEGDEPHRYVLTLYALHGTLDVNPGAPPEEVRAAIGAGALARGQLTGRYGR